METFSTKLKSVFEKKTTIFRKKLAHQSYISKSHVGVRSIPNKIETIKEKMMNPCETIMLTTLIKTDIIEN